MTQTIIHPQSHPAHHSEEILVVKRTHLFKNNPAWTGLKSVDFNEYLSLITEHQEFHPRYVMENDPTYKQIIPYLIFKHKNTYFLMERHKKASETRLASKLTLGIGGHIRKEDIPSIQHADARHSGQGSKAIFSWATREFHEEVNYEGNLTFKPLGVLNDDSNAVGQVHIGFVFLLEGDSDAISVKSELASGKLVNLEELKAVEARLESWSAMALKSLI